MQIRIGFGWVRPDENDPTHSTLSAGIKYYLCLPRDPLTSNLKLGTLSPFGSH
jgi:hypothetical protein